jgi:CBS domain containing-hemolysin-like protein
MTKFDSKLLNSLFEAHSKDMLAYIRSRFPNEESFQFQRLPHAGESCLVEYWKFEVIDMDGARIDKALAIPFKSEV